MYDPEYSSKPKVKLFFDIETIPADEKFKDIAVELATQKEYSKKGPFRKSTAKLEYIFRQTAISGDFGSIFCIGYAINNGSVEIIKGAEAAILEKWWQVVNWDYVESLLNS